MPGASRLPPPPAKVTERIALQCTLLHDACLTIQQPQPHCSRDCPSSSRPFRIDVYGRGSVNAASIVAWEQRGIRDLLNSFVMRHVERDIFVHNASLTPEARVPNSSLAMLWPRFENGFGDLNGGTIVPLGYALARGFLPAHLAISGVKNAHAFSPLLAASSICTFEREAPPIPHCTSKCYDQLSICSLKTPQQAQAWLGMSALDERLGFARAHATDLPLLPSDMPREVRVVFARRRGRRLINNIDELLHQCEQRATLIAPPLHFVCSAHHFSELQPKAVVATLRQADVFVAMHGGDVVNALHLRPGSAVFEAINQYMVRRWSKVTLAGGVRYDGWLDQNGRCCCRCIASSGLRCPRNGRSRTGTTMRICHGSSWSARCASSSRHLIRTGM